MALKWHFLLMLSTVVLTTAPSAMTSPQTPGDLEQRYGTPDDKGRYVARPDILVSVMLADERQEQKFAIKPNDRSPSSADSVQPMKPETVTEIINELAPMNQRGKLVNSIIFSASCTSIEADEYEQIRINRVVTCATGGGVASAEIIWKVPRGQ